jgi:hypothetical protein
VHFSPIAYTLIIYQPKKTPKNPKTPLLKIAELPTPKIVFQCILSQSGKILPPRWNMNTSAPILNAQISSF